MVDSPSTPDARLARKLLEAAAQRGGEVDLDDLVQIFPSKERFADIVPALRLLEEEGKGRFIVGRRGRQTRFICAEAVVEKTRASQAARQRWPDERTASVLKQYEFPVRKGVVADLRLPHDLTKAEAERLSQFILAIPFD